jgi:hypothetical protein
MISLRNSKLQRAERRVAILLLLGAILLLSGCSSLIGIKKSVKVHPLLTPLQTATAAELVAEVNRLASVRSIRGKVDLQFEDTTFAEAGLAEKYRTADGTLTLQRPGQILLVIQTPFFPTDVAEMTSDGTRFRVAILQGDESYRRFVMGTNEAPYSQFGKNTTQSEQGGKEGIAAQTQHTVNVLSNLRPQHLTEALLVYPIEISGRSHYLLAQSEIYEDEPDTRPLAGKNSRAVRGYYILDELAPGSDGIARELHRFWFDRVGRIRLAKMQNYDDRGVLITDVKFGELKPFGEQSMMLPSRIELTRPKDSYKISVNYQAPETVRLDREYPVEAFILQNKWVLPEVNLDERGTKPGKAQ